MIRETADKDHLWLVLHTRPKCERKVLERLDKEGIHTFLPLQKVIRQWSDRKKKIEVPMFPNYLFVNLRLVDRFKALGFPGMIRYVSNGNKYLPDVVPQEEIFTIRELLSHRKVDSTARFDFKEGDKALITTGPFKGLEGYLIRRQGVNRLIVRVDIINQYLVVELYPNDVVKVQQS